MFGERATQLEVEMDEIAIELTDNAYKSIIDFLDAFSLKTKERKVLNKVTRRSDTSSPLTSKLHRTCELSTA